jgi:MFS family permease
LPRRLAKLLARRSQRFELVDGLDGLVADTAGDDAGRHDSGSLGGEAGAGDRPTGDGARPAQEARERGRELDDAEPLDCGAARALLALEGGAFGTLAEVRPQRTLFGAREASVHSPGQRRLGFAAGERTLELLTEGAAGPEEHRLDGRDREVEDVADLRVGAALQLAHHERRALVEAEVGKRGPQLLGGGHGFVGRRRRRPLVPLHLARPAGGGAEALPALVVGDLQQPVARLLGLLTACERTEGAEKGRLCRVLGVGLVAQDGEHVAIDVVDVPAVETLERSVSRWCAAEQCGAHPRVLVDACALVTLRSFPDMAFKKRLRSTGGYGALQERQFRLLWLGRTASSIGDALIPVALAFAVIEETGSATDLGIVMSAYTASRVLLILVGGVWADRLPRRAVMVAADIVRFLSQGLLALLLITDSAEIWHLATAGAVSGGAQAFFGPASTALVPETVSAGRLQQANALLALSGSGAEIFGPALSGLLVAGIGPGWVVAVDATSFGVSAAFLLAMRLPKLPPAPAERFLADLRAGWREIAARRWLLGSLATFALGNLTIASYFVLGPLIVERELGGARDWGLILSGGAAGGVVGGVLALRWRPRRPLLIGFLLLLPQPVTLLTLIPPLPTLGLAVGAALGFGTVSFFNPLWETVLQEQIPRQTLSRVTSYDWMVSLVFMPIGYTIAGPLSEQIGVDATLWAAFALATGAILFALAIPGLRRLERLAPTPLPSPASGSGGESPAPAPRDPLP